MELTKTNRGFPLGTFTDRNGIGCSIQKSSIATEDCIWLGADTVGLKEFVAYRDPAWKDLVEFDQSTVTHSYIANNRMHLSRDQVAELLPLLQRFVETGEIDP
jgi:hypothetical protein